MLSIAFIAEIIKTYRKMSRLQNIARFGFTTDLRFFSDFVVDSLPSKRMMRSRLSDRLFSGPGRHRYNQPAGVVRAKLSFIGVLAQI
jgi:hypothetical protein